MLNGIHQGPRARSSFASFMSRGFILFYVLMFPAQVSLAAHAEAPSAAYTERVWQMQDGLPEQIVQAFAQTADRYLWIGTTGGLLRFDGARFQQYDRDNTPAFSDNDIFCLMVARDNTLWIGSEGGGLIRYRQGVFHAFGISEGLSNSFVRTVYQDGKGEIWIGTDNGLFRMSGEQVVRVDNTANLPAIAVHAVAQDKSGRLWVGGSRLIRIEGHSVREYPLQGEAGQNRVKSILVSEDGAIWVGTISGLQKMEPESIAAPGWQAAFTKVKEIDRTVRLLRQTSDGTLWIGTIGQGLYTYRGHHFSEMKAPANLPSNTVFSLLEDLERNIWIGTQVGMLRLSKTPVRTVVLPDAADSDAETVYQDHDGDIWVAAVNLFRVHHGKVSPQRFEGIRGVRIRNVFRDRDGALWIGTEGQGVYRQTNGRLTHYSMTEGLVNNFIRAFLQGGDGSIWIGTDEGVSRWRGQRFTNYQVRDGLSYFSIRSLLEDRNGDIWIGTERGVNHLRGESFVHDEVTEALKDEKVWALHQDADGGLWFGTRTAGLFRWRSGKLTHYTVAHGLASSGIYELLEDHHHNMWMSGPTGISVISRSELDAIADQAARSVSLVLYGASDGLQSIQMYGGEKPAGVLTDQGEVWFSSSKGPVRVSVNQPRPVGPAPVVIEQVTADGRDVALSGSVPLGPDNAKLEVHYGVVLLRSQERVRFRYRLQGFDRDWSEPTLGRVAYYTNLPPGKYQFRVAAFEMNNPEQITESALEIVQKPHFYRTVWFLACCVLLLAAIIFAAYQFRLGRLRARFHGVLAERNRLAREMHDTLIQGCTSVSAVLEAYSTFGHSDPKSKQDLLDCARVQLRSTIAEVREAVWDLRHRNGSVPAIAPLLQKMAEQISHEFNVPVECQISGKPFDIDQSTVHELLMVAREALYNAVRHAKPGKTALVADFDGNRFRLQVRDDGLGFDLQSESVLSEEHYGLIGMQERVTHIGGTFRLKSHPGAGTELTVELARKAVTPSEKVPDLTL
jgi:ligand-binding sensor domain-containing protein/signal transduction histidine kinase